MKRYIAYLGLFTALCPSTSVWAGKSLPDLTGDIEKISSTLHQKRSSIDGSQLVGEIKALSKQFEDLDADEDIWQSFITQYNKKGREAKKQDQKSKTREIEVWLDQTPKQAVGSHLFFPEEVEELRDSRYTEHLLKRTDMIWSFAIASWNNDPRGYYYLSRTLGGIWKDYNDPYGTKEKFYPKFFEELAQKAVKGLKHSVDKDVNEPNPEALSILSEEHVSTRGDFLRDHNLLLSIDYLEKIGTSPKASQTQIGRSKTRLLNFRKVYKSQKPVPMFSEYKEVAETYSYGKALVEGVGHVGRENSKEENLKYLEEAASKYGYYHSYIGLGVGIKSKNDEKAEEYFAAAGDNGIPHGYIEAGLFYLGKDILGKDSEKLATYLGDIPEENIDEAKKWFQKAINKNDFQGWDYMASLSYALSLLDKENKDSKVQKAFREAVKKGADLGSPRAYSWLEHSFDSQDVKEIVQKHGQSPYKDLWKDLKSFIEAK